MRPDLDHLLVCRPPGAPGAEALVAAGFREGPPNRHPGQGTACRRFFFHDAYLELFWLEDPGEANAPPVRDTRLGERADPADPACGLGVCLRIPPGADLPVETWAYAPPYLPPGLSIPMGANSTRTREPLVFFLPPAFAQAERPKADHANGACRVTGARLTLPPVPRPSDVLRWLAGCGAVEVAFGEEEALALVLDGGRSGETVELPGSPRVTLTW